MPYPQNLGLCRQLCLKLTEYSAISFLDADRLINPLIIVPHRGDLIRSQKNRQRFFRTVSPFFLLSYFLFSFYFFSIMYILTAAA